VPHLQAIRGATLHARRADALSGSVVSTAPALIAYLTLASAELPYERLQAIFLDPGGRALAEETVSHGSVLETPIYPREILRRALELGASALILAHNHPSGDPQPSRGDVAATRRLVEAAALVGVEVRDHLVIARSGWSSFRALGLL
jgi:DNA repair protein RadC